MSSRPAPRDLRASDSDRDRVISALSSAFSDGRLTQEEFSERASVACTAKTLGELAALTTDLSQTPLMRLDGGHQISGIFAPARRDGRWVVPETVAVTAVRSTVEVDFRQALLQSSRVIVNVTAIVGKVYLYVPDGIRVEVTGRALLGRTSMGRNSGGAAMLHGSPDTPVLQVRALVLGGKLEVRTPPKPRRFRLFARR
jgi:Domain of unknown function (DUF1707)/Cell wall-active antibiotics response 4TMS YvqF